MLLLLESVAATAPEVHERAVRRVLGAYLDPTADGGDFRPPRFLLNDLVRYWRTIAVDFEAKHRAGDGADAKWVLRNAKLRLSRKLLFAGGLVPVLLCREQTTDEMADFLIAQLAAPPTDRLAAAFLQTEASGGVDAGARTLGAYDRWIGLLADPDARAELAGARPRGTARQRVVARGSRPRRPASVGTAALLFQTELAPISQELPRLLSVGRSRGARLSPGSRPRSRAAGPVRGGAG